MKVIHAYLHHVVQTRSVALLEIKVHAPVYPTMLDGHPTVGRNARSMLNALVTKHAKMNVVSILAQDRADTMPFVELLSIILFVHVIQVMREILWFNAHLSLFNVRLYLIVYFYTNLPFYIHIYIHTYLVLLKILCKYLVFKSKISLLSQTNRTTDLNVFSPN